MQKTAYLEESLKILSEIRHPAYYVKMAVAWALSIFYIRFPKEVLALLLAEKSGTEDTYRMTLQKIVESRKVPADEKEQIRQMRKRNSNNQKYRINRKRQGTLRNEVPYLFFWQGIILRGLQNTTITDGVVCAGILLVAAP